jgi:DNA invertase Pin-like site-specific DNA recombinase
VTRRLLPANPEQLRGLRARRYVRVSSEDQGTKYGPDRQHEEVDRAIARLGLEEAGEPFVDEQSAWSRSDERPELRRLVTAAIAGEYDVLVLAYFSRWSRNAEVGLRIRRELHAAGVVLFFADEWFLSSDVDQLEQFVTEAAAAEVYSIKLARNITKTFAAKFERYGDQAGSPGLGFMRTPQPEARLAIDVATMPDAVALFERYAVGDVSYRELAAETGIAEGALRAILTNPLYNGWARRHRRQPDETRVAAPWRSSPPVDDELWAHVAEVRSTRAKAAGRRRARHVHLLAKRMWCECGRLVKADTSRQRNGDIVRRYVHQGCHLWSRENVVAHRLDGAIEGQISGLRLDVGTLARIRSLATAPAPVDTRIRKAQLEAELRRKATDHAARRLTTEAYLAEHTRITAEIDGLASVAPGGPVADADDVVRRLQELEVTWKKAGRSDGLAARAAVVASIYRRITVVDGAITEVDLTDDAKRLGLVLALPETVAMARPARGRLAKTTVTIPIVGRREWLRASRSA